jgi:predicted aminopeptidase
MLIAAAAVIVEGIKSYKRLGFLKLILLLCILSFLDTMSFSIFHELGKRTDLFIITASIILKHSNASFIHLTQNVNNGKFFIRIHHDGKGITQADFEKMNKSSVGLGLKNIQSRMKVLNGSVVFEKDQSQTFYKVTTEMPISSDPNA